jgi:hypothetical protein
MSTRDAFHNLDPDTKAAMYDSAQESAANDYFFIWEELVNKIREWDRREHNWAVTNKVVDRTNLITKASFIGSLMQQYELKKK